MYLFISHRFCLPIFHSSQFRVLSYPKYNIPFSFTPSHSLATNLDKLQSRKSVATMSSPPSSPSPSSTDEPSLRHQQQHPSIDFKTDKFPFCIVWTPIPVLTWFFPFIGHMGIAMSNGVIRDFAGPYFVSEDNMGFGRPTRYLQLSPQQVLGGGYEWDESVSKASVVYGTRMHNLFCDNCHSHVAMALTSMKYKNRTNWNMIVLALWLFVCGKYVGVGGVIRTWLPFAIVVTLCVVLGIYL